MATLAGYGRADGTRLTVTVESGTLKSDIAFALLAATVLALLVGATARGRRARKARPDRRI